MATTIEKNPKVVTIHGRLSFPEWTAQLAFDKSQKSDYPAKTVGEAKPSANLVIEQHMLDRLLTQIKDEFLPYCVKQNAAGEKRDSLTQKEVDNLLEQIDNQLADPTFEPVYNTPLRVVGDKTKDLAPAAVASLKVIGNAGTDLVQKAVVREPGDLLVPDPDLLSFPTVRPLGETRFQMYPGAQVGVTINLYAYHNGKLPGFSAGGTVVVFRADDDPFGGGLAVDEDEMFVD